MAYEIVQMNEKTWRIENEFVRFFLLEGSKEALLIDCGASTPNAKEIAEGLTNLPIKLLITHADGDHMAGKSAFETFYMHPAEAVNYYNKKNFLGETLDGDFEPVTEGCVIDLGDRPLEIISIPGHTPGSIAILDVNARILYSGDTVQDGEIFMFGPYREVHAFVKSLCHLETFRDRFDEIYPSHGTLPVAPSIIPELCEGVKKVLAGGCEAAQRDMYGTVVAAYDMGVATLLMES